ncbi:hypothetical protein B0H11DRAFT_578639 [Mycena galericulata]|nr:hypothetical protein B0H11DRAFT_578639 [Mycena galericulata]
MPAVDHRQAYTLVAEPYQKGINSLPVEILCTVFAFTRSPAGSGLGNRNLPSVHTLSHVCRLWRNVAQALCPELWTDIWIFHCRSGQLEMVDEYLRRSNTLLVNILLDIPSNVTVDRHQLATFWSVLLRIWSVSHRWRILHISTTQDNFWAIKLNVGRKAVPLLESLELRVTSSSSNEQTDLYFESMFALKSLALHDIMLQTPVESVSSFAQQMETLDLSAKDSFDLLLKLGEQFDISAQNSLAVPRLRHLTLRTSVPPLDGRSGPLFKSYISSLTTLTLGHLYSNFQESGLAALCRLLVLPLLEELTFDGINAFAWRIIADSLGDARLTFPAVRTLTLASVGRCTLTEHSHLFDAFPALEQLRLIDMDSSKCLTVLSNPPSEPVLWPSLHTIAVTNADYRAMS